MRFSEGLNILPWERGEGRGSLWALEGRAAGSMFGRAAAGALRLGGRWGEPLFLLRDAELWLLVVLGRPLLDGVASEEAEGSVRGCWSLCGRFGRR